MRQWNSSRWNSNLDTINAEIQSQSITRCQRTTGLFQHIQVSDSTTSIGLIPLTADWLTNSLVSELSISIIIEALREVLLSTSLVLQESTLITGWLPYTLLLLFSLFILPWKKFSKSKFVENAKKATPLQVFTWLAFLLVLFFYCIPKSKRSVYLLPCYPFMAYLIAEYIVWMMKEKMGAFKVYAGVIASLAILLIITRIAVSCGLIPDTIFHGRHAAENTAMLHALEKGPQSIAEGIGYLFFILCIYGIYATFQSLRRNHTGSIVGHTLITIISLFMILDSTLQPTVLNTKADKRWAPVIEKKFDTSKLYSYMSIDMLHFFSLNFYLGDKIQQFDKTLPQDGIVMVSNDDIQIFTEKYGSNYTFEKVWEIPRTAETRCPVGFYRFVKTSANLACN